MSDKINEKRWKDQGEVVERSMVKVNSKTLCLCFRGRCTRVFG